MTWRHTLLDGVTGLSMGRVELGLAFLTGTLFGIPWVGVLPRDSLLRLTTLPYDFAQQRGAAITNTGAAKEASSNTAAITNTSAATKATPTTETAKLPALMPTGRPPAKMTPCHQRPAHPEALPATAPSTLPPFAVVSASFGGRGFHQKLSRCVLYTDKEIPEPNNWTVVHFPYHQHLKEQWPRLYANGRYSWENIQSKENEKVQRVMAAKMYKMLMFLLPEVQGAQVVLWIDSDHIHDMSKLDTLHSRAAHLLNGKALAIEIHPKRDTVKAELKEAAAWAAYGRGMNYKTVLQDVNDGYQHMTANGFLDKQGLYWCGMYILNLSSETLCLALQEWWMIVQNYSFRDQISFPYVVQRNALNLNKFKPLRLEPGLRSGGS